MKISLRWLCDHIEGLLWKNVDISKLISLFNAQVAEIEQVEKVTVSVSEFHAVRIVAQVGGTMTVQGADKNLYELPARSDALLADQLAAYLIISDAGRYRWVTLHEIGCEKDGLVPALHIPDADLAGKWKLQWEEADVILDVDNKSLTHRPDMWGHRGFAREVAALFGKRLLAEDSFLTPLAMGTSLALVNEAEQACTGLAAVRIDNCNPAASDVRAVSRLVKIGYRPRNGMIDVTNYVMADWGHPMHAYDAAVISGAGLTVRFAQPGQTIKVLDGSDLVLESADMVIADTQGAVALAGVMGGALSAVSATTTQVLLEAGCFHASTIRRSAARHKIRTESSQRFEKTLDNEQLVATLQRCVTVGRAWGVFDHAQIGLLTVNKTSREPLVLSVSHNYIFGRIGITVLPEVIVRLLTSIDFIVTYKTAQYDTLYTIVVPSYRSTKDISGPHDIVEEVARLYGFDNIVPLLPSFVHRASSLQSVMRERAVKNYLVQGAGMQEQRNYAFYSEQVLDALGWHEEEYLTLQNPVSQDARRLIGSLMPHLLANVMDNAADVEQCAFFEWGTVWPSAEQIERKELAGIWYKKRGAFDFYELKKVVTQVCHLANVHPEWRPLAAGDKQYQWLAPSPSAVLIHDGVVIGAFGQVHPVLVQKIGGLPESSAFGFVVNATLLQNNLAPRYTAGRMRKFQHSTIDLSVLIPQATTVVALEKALCATSDLIEHVRLIDFFEKKEWKETRSVAFRLLMSHPERTLTKEEVEAVRRGAIECLISHGGQLRE